MEEIVKVLLMLIIGCLCINFVCLLVAEVVHLVRYLREKEIKK